MTHTGTITDERRKVIDKIAHWLDILGYKDAGQAVQSLAKDDSEAA